VFCVDGCVRTASETPSISSIDPLALVAKVCVGRTNHQLACDHVYYARYPHGVPCGGKRQVFGGPVRI
jgi:hypothetical protein